MDDCIEKDGFIWVWCHEHGAGPLQPNGHVTIKCRACGLNLCKSLYSPSPPSILYDTPSCSECGRAAAAAFSLDGPDYEEFCREE